MAGGSDRKGRIKIIISMLENLILPSVVYCMRLDNDHANGRTYLPGHSG